MAEICSSKPLLPASLSLYRSFSYLLSPAIDLFVHLRSSSHGGGSRALLGESAVPRPAGPLLWFHAASVGESLAALSLAEFGLKANADLKVLITTRTRDALRVLEKYAEVSDRIFCQSGPMDTPRATATFIQQWQPQGGIFLESELWPNLLAAAHEAKVPLALVNARISDRSVQRWLATGSAGKSLVAWLLRNFRVVLPMNTTEGLKFQRLGLPPANVKYAGNLKYAVSQLPPTAPPSLGDLRGRRVWIAASIHAGEEEAAIQAHRKCQAGIPGLLTLVAPRHPHLAAAIRKVAGLSGMRDSSIGQRSRGDSITETTQVYIIDTIGELRYLYSAVEVAFVGGSLLPGMTGHNMAEPAHSSVALLTGRHLGHFNAMVLDMCRVSELAVEQVNDGDELGDAVLALFLDPRHLLMRQQAAKKATDALQNVILDKVWLEVVKVML